MLLRIIVADYLGCIYWGLDCSSPLGPTKSAPMVTIPHHCAMNVKLMRVRFVDLCIAVEIIIGLV